MERHSVEASPTQRLTEKMGSMENALIKMERITEKVSKSPNP